MKNICIVGGSSGIGLSLTRKAKEAGHQVIVLSRESRPELSTLGVTHIPWDVNQALDTQIEQLPTELHGLAYCPGTINLKPFHRLSEEEFMHDFQVNVMGAIRILQGTVKNLRKARGSSVVLFSTVASKLGMNFHSSIAVAKSGVEGLTKSLAAEWANHKVRVNCVAPSLTDTPLASKLLSSDDKREAASKRHPMNKIGTPDDIAELAYFLLSDQSSWLTGQIIGVDGGMANLKP